MLRSIAVACVGISLSWSCLLGQIEAATQPGVAIGAIRAGGRADYEISTGNAFNYEEASATQPNNTNFRQELLMLVNIERVKANLTAVCMNRYSRSSLFAIPHIALGDWSSVGLEQQIEQSGSAPRERHGHEELPYFSHTGWNGSSFMQRITYSGFRAGWAGEIIAAGQVNAGAAMVSWMNSLGHRAIILGPNYKFVGAGDAYNASAQWKHHWVQDFASSTTASCG